MKKTTFTFMLLIIFLTTGACSNEAANENEPESVEEESTETDREESVEENQPEEDTKSVLTKKSEVILKLLEEKNEEELANHIHPEKGVLFSPSIYIEDESVTFDVEQTKNFLKDTKKYTWGNQDGSGEPIELTPSEYYSEYIFDANYLQADEVEYDRKEARGNAKSNITEEFPDSHTLEYYVKGTEENENMDWKALNLVFEKDAEDEWKLVAIVHDQWTI